ncbi:hypothetical protein ACLH04_23045 [Enterobacter hormaechei]|uniref:hypothetical protein n=1 Tax=Enterobacteriaceae TaxID=543 RepID=UPI00079AC285|nr:MULTISPECIES: hypothetical protein [Enterobacteriaceae]HBV4879270.1 hypothetical protein [Klebsiella pneumoniae]HDU5280816.1 hypothetical protein [Klebsiella aerogenes]MDI0409468.1 hypothetical protein [Escherichia coli]CZW42640.1 Uncharacterised protein [Enterobacter hormaechei]SAD17910.1 Uncharacterised protein [Enterobacter hormaechei]
MTFAEIMSVLKSNGWQVEWLLFLIPYSDPPVLISGARKIAEFSPDCKIWKFTVAGRTPEDSEKVSLEIDLNKGETFLEMDEFAITYIDKTYAATGAQFWID